MKTFLLIAVSGLAATLVADKWIIRFGPEDDGFIDSGEGLGADNAVYGVLTAAFYQAGKALLRKT